MGTTSETAVMTVEEAGAQLGLSRSAAYDAARQGRIPVIRLGRKVLVPRIAFQKLLETGSSPKAA
ncbi:MAG TPA: helix-turn-helix domain-containing protein [Magnetospirillaceae bacterium]|jgi:excisionase family DNA binding protein